MADVNVTITIPDEYVERVLDAFDKNFNGRGETELNRAQWAKSMLNNWIKRVVRHQEMSAAKNTAISSVTDVELL